MRKYFLFFFCLFYCTFFLNYCSFAGTNHPEYAAQLIPENLIENSNTVIRYSHDELKIYSSSKAEIQKKIVFTILNKEGAKNGYKSIFYDKFTKIKNIEGSIYDSNGNFIRKITSDDTHDMSAISSFSVYEDSRRSITIIQNDIYPYTIEFYYNLVFSGISSLPSWYPVPRPNISLEKADCLLQLNEGLDCRNRQNNLQEPLVTSEKGLKNYLWTLENYPAKIHEPFSPPYKEFYPAAEFVLMDFNLDGFQGSGTDWKSLGNFFYSMNKDRDDLPIELIAEINKIFDKSKSKTENVRRLYEYLQNTTRYVNISLGIGGLQTYDANYVYKNKYGDCKALTNYMKAILKYCGIDSYQALVNAGEDENDVREDFPSLDFNHVILFVPLEADTLWLECTSQRIPFGFLGSFTEARHVLCITPYGGILTKTPTSSAIENMVSSNMKVKLDSNGRANSSISILFKGNNKEKIISIFSEMNLKEQKQFINEMLELPSLEMKDYKIEKDELNNGVVLKINLEIPKIASTTSSRMFVPLNLLNKETNIPINLQKREQPVYSNEAITYTDTITFTLPDNFKIENLKKEPVSIISSFGSYTSIAFVDEEKNTIRYTRNFSLNRFLFPSEKYDDLRKFYSQIVKEDKIQAVLIK